MASMTRRRRSCTKISQDICMKHIIGTTSSQLVLNHEYLLTLILLRVPYTELLSLKSVSKQWHSLITTPHFTSLLRNSIPPLRASGLLVRCPVRARDEVHFVPLDNSNTTSLRSITFAHDPFYSENVRILQSCNGLLLCSSAIYRLKEWPKCYVNNLSTNHLDTLPQHPRGSGHWVRYVGLSFDPSKSIHYKVVAFSKTSVSPYGGDFRIYSSETGTWKASVQSFIPPPGAKVNGGVYWNGCIHWLSKLNSGSEPEPEPTVSDCLYFNVDDEWIETFPRPPTSVRRSASGRSLYFGESEGHLHFIEACPYATSLIVYEMKSDYSGWFVKYQFDLDPISKLFPEMTKHKATFHEKNDNAVAVLSLIRRENFREDPFLVLEIPGKLIRYNLVTRSVRMIWHFSGDLIPENIDDWFFENFQVWQYIESVVVST